MTPISDWDRRVGDLAGMSLPETLGRMVAADAQLGNVAPALPDLRQIVGEGDDQIWIINRQPQRAQRPTSSPTVNPRSSPILFENILRSGRQCWVRFRTAGTELVALTNPFPHLAGTVTITLATEHAQTFNLGCDEPSRALINHWADLAVGLSQDLPGFYVSFNGPEAGNTQPQFHFSVNRLPDSIDMFPVERTIYGELPEPGRLLTLGAERDYPTSAIISVGAGSAVAERLTEMLHTWTSAPERTGNVLLRSDNVVTTAIFWPRVRAWRRAPGIRSGEIAFMELCGMFVLSDERDLEGVDSGAHDYMHFWRALRAVGDRSIVRFCETWARPAVC